MARKGPARTKERKSRPRALNRKDDTIQRWKTASDIPLDEEDQFHANRDRILLEGEDVASDDEGDEEEVFALKGMPEDDDEDDDEEEGADDEQMQEDEDDNLEELAAQFAKANAKSKKGKGKQKEADAPEEEGSESGSEEEGWGRTKSAYYASNADELASDDEEANEMEEQEAKRLQLKARDVLADDDFGFGDSAEPLVEPQTEASEAAPPIVIASLPTDKHDLIRHLEKTNPEALALARDWDDVARTLVQTQEKIARMEASEAPVRGVVSGMAHLHYQALLQYAVTLAFYLYLRSSEEYAARPDLLRSHPIMSRLLSFKQHIATLEELQDSDDEDDFSEDDLDLEGLDFDMLFRGNRSELADELRELLAEKVTPSSQAASAEKPSPVADGRKSKKTEKKGDEPPKKKRKTSSVAAAKPSLPVFDLEEPEFPNKPKAAARHSTSTDDAFGEQTTLDVADAADKASRKRTLRFHTAKIESASARRERARTSTGGDDDIPWKERKREREERQKKELEKSRGAGGADLDEEEPEPRDTASKKRNRDDGDDDESDDDGTAAERYYDLVKRMSKEKKEQKKAEYEEALAEAKESLLADEPTDGPRALTRAILKNRGLTPHRSKSVRNPRVKKRMRYEKAKKKVASQRAVYKGGLSATGRYEGEKSGISKVIKSRQL